MPVYSPPSLYPCIHIHPCMCYRLCLLETPCSLAQSSSPGWPWPMGWMCLCWRDWCPDQHTWEMRMPLVLVGHTTLFWWVPNSLPCHTNGKRANSWRKKAFPHIGAIPRTYDAPGLWEQLLLSVPSAESELYRASFKGWACKTADQPKRTCPELTAPIRDSQQSGPRRITKEAFYPSWCLPFLLKWILEILHLWETWPGIRFQAKRTERGRSRGLPPWSQH